MPLCGNRNGLVGPTESSDCTVEAPTTPTAAATARHWNYRERDILAVRESGKFSQRGFEMTNLLKFSTLTASRC